MLRTLFTSTPVRSIDLSLNSVHRLFLVGLLGSGIQLGAYANTSDGFATFDANFLPAGMGEQIDVTQFSHRHSIPPGYYDVGILLNEKNIGHMRLLVRKIEGKSVICTTRPLMNLIPLRAEEIDSNKWQQLDDADQCYGLEHWIPDASAHINTSTLHMVISVPQALLERQAQNEVSPLLWDKGVNALILGYDNNYYQSKQGGSVYRSFYNGDNISLNILGLMFRHRGSLSWDEESGAHYSSLRNYVEYGISPLKSRIIVGDTDTSGNLFDSFSLRGVTLYSDDNMLPDSRRGYAPMIRGVAETNARVSIRQNNTLLYETTVSPGPFNIDDLYPTGYGGDLVVTVHESDGRINQFMVPYAAVPQLIRPGITRYSFSAGTLRNMNVSQREKVAQVTVQRGINNLITGYGGILSTPDYHAFMLGGAMGSTWGALALDVTQAQTFTPSRDLTGQSYRATYSKRFNSSNSTVTFAAMRFSSSGYLDLKNAMQVIDHDTRRKADEAEYLFYSPRSRISASLSQGFKDNWGQLYLTAIRQSYWGKGGSNNQLQMGYSNSFRSVSWSFSVNRVNARDGAETQYTLGLSVPLGGGSPQTHLNMNFSHDADGLSSQANLNSSLGAHQQFDYSVGMRHDKKQRTTANAAASLYTPYTSIQGTVEKGRQSHSWSTGLQGSVAILHDGITAGPWHSETMALVDAPYATGAHVEGHSGLTLNHQGRALVPYLMPYRLNDIRLDPQELPLDVELKSTQQQIVPHSGALVKVNFSTSRGRPVLIHTTLPDGQSLPFGASVLDEEGTNLGLVAQGDIIYVRLPAGDSRLRVTSGDEEICMLKVHLSPLVDAQNGFERFEQPCLPTSTL
ncbi:fimbria/pilus outer membrane usher protein [Erwinia sorbitola]|uniref:Fimbria/pilus outer membrane usher protein n=1 Tax=Erwinia sorbitola TaxID=2681984 RepID=A0A6I6EQ72_9GAMM|nr:fimbria/pilus outer membrane usher protein [Erwinia sorbitola]MTD28729.1 fimbria/pilus outer membrane usher protein [Erwinia sorbitola]QGU86822.1 fimbria/pilus outer membrane usher protein [Erwinia sorbitola]